MVSDKLEKVFFRFHHFVNAPPYLGVHFRVMHERKRVPLDFLSGLGLNQNLRHDFPLRFRSLGLIIPILEILSTLFRFYFSFLFLQNWHGFTVSLSSSAFPPEPSAGAKFLEFLHSYTLL